MTDESASTDLDWGDLGYEWWQEAGANCHATQQQIVFALHRHKGMTATGSAKAAGYAGDGPTIRHRPDTVQPTPRLLWGFSAWLKPNPDKAQTETLL
jgi:hypothetical protein